MDITTEVRPGANRYACGENILQDLPSYLAGFKKIAVITGEKSSEAFKKYYRKELHYPTYRYDGSSSHENAVELANKIEEAELILAIGGGRVIDTAKMTAEELNAELMVIPTLISNCAPFTPIVAVYHPNRTFKAMGFMKRAPFLTLVDSKFLLATPKDYFVAGIGDTLAKWYEIEGITRNLQEDEKTAYIRLGIASARAIQELLLKDAIPAIEDLENHKATPAFSRVTDTIIGLAGETGGFAASFGRSAGAHAIHDGLSYLESTHNQLHGKKVAYGILVQLAHTDNLDEIKNLKAFYQATGLPLKLKDLNVLETSKEALESVISHAASSSETFKMIDPKITSEQIYKAIQVVESL
ncbi:iron-containing alcohol dehydrogenase family protein [Candidatus Enterococcus murrayae]|uniref:Iron-containing alcohol dehydrogenase family protein n=1 Tax=Candidatus Enterococcus murrayae TaxID=2815321 RepID=A0ABS3HJQ3_9ENTE|nr:iron-containing alcohol dehydrogenase family protein [Enterococcus sp. MJM16]MBO0453164.1 iron-containing alcohol dehydrogenase family protein [Enterococcus sp. MJM16]